jgi:hypothetical protein
MGANMIIGCMIISWVFGKQLDDLLGWCDKLQLVTKGDWSESMIFTIAKIHFLVMTYSITMERFG